MTDLGAQQRGLVAVMGPCLVPFRVSSLKVASASQVLLPTALVSFPDAVTRKCDESNLREEVLLWAQGQRCSPGWRGSQCEPESASHSHPLSGSRE